MNQHMGTTVPGVRGSVMINNLKHVFKDTTWENFKERHVGDHEYGWTRFNDLTVVAYYFKHRFALTAASIDIGYGDSGTYAETNGRTAALTSRLKRINAESILEIGRSLMRYHLITKNDLKHILTDPVYPPPNPGPGTRPWKSIMYQYFAKRIVLEAIKKWGGRRAAARQLNVKLTVITYWAELDVADPMVRAAQRNA